MIKLSITIGESANGSTGGIFNDESDNPTPMELELLRHEVEEAKFENFAGSLRMLAAGLLATNLKKNKPT